MSSASTATEKDKIVVRCGPVRKLLILPDTYEGALKLVSEAFLLPQNMPQIAFSAKLGGSGAMTKDARQEEFTPISENNWTSLRDQVKVLRVVKQPIFEMPAAASVEPAVKGAAGNRIIKVVHEFYSRTYEIRATSPLQVVFQNFSTYVAISLDDLKFYYEAQVLEPSDTPSSLDLPQTITLSAMRYYVTFNLYYDYPKSIPVRMKHSAPMAEVFDLAESCRKPCVDSFAILRDDGIMVRGKDRAGDIFSASGASIHCAKRQAGGKPVIYLFPPQPLQATVRLSLEPSWKFDALYPIAPVQDDLQNGWQSINWEVDATPEGNIRDKESGMEVTYLFWEAKTLPKLNRAVVVASTAFIPGQTSCQPENSVLLPVQRITQYLDRTLALLGLHTSARTDFVTYWLPRFLQHKHIALRFVSQEAYEKAAPLDISPKPDVVTRIFMLFQGVTVDEVTGWSEAEARVTEDAVFWRNVVGIDPVKQQDGTLFRVLEWGGMEVYGQNGLPAFSEGGINLE